MSKTLVPLASDPRATLPTRECAEHLSIHSRTLRRMAAEGRAPIKPVVVAGNLRWPTAQLRELLGA